MDHRRKLILPTGWTQGRSVRRSGSKETNSQRQSEISLLASHIIHKNTSVLVEGQRGQWRDWPQAGILGSEEGIFFLTTPRPDLGPVTLQSNG
jgi:hypothetical protein